MSFIGATQDIASDGVYVTSLDTRTQALVLPACRACRGTSGRSWRPASSST
ncbi:hypothetical protein [Massilia phosphatilytica]